MVPMLKVSTLEAELDSNDQVIKINHLQDRIDTLVGEIDTLDQRAAAAEQLVEILKAKGTYKFHTPSYLYYISYNRAGSQACY